MLQHFPLERVCETLSKTHDNSTLLLFVAQFLLLCACTWSTDSWGEKVWLFFLLHFLCFTCHVFFYGKCLHFWINPVTYGWEALSNIIHAVTNSKKSIHCGSLLCVCSLWLIMAFACSLYCIHHEMTKRISWATWSKTALHLADTLAWNPKHSVAYLSDLMYFPRLFCFFRLFSLLLCCHILHRVMKLWIFLDSKWVRSSLQMSMATSSPKRSAFPSYRLLLAAKSL